MSCGFGSNGVTTVTIGRISLYSSDLFLLPSLYTYCASLSTSWGTNWGGIARDENEFGDVNTQPSQNFERHQLTYREAPGNV
jgi:hypothetical protein